MSFLDDLAKFIAGRTEEANNPRQPEGEVDTPQEVEEELEEYDLDTEKQGLFALGFFSDDVSPDVRQRAREEYQQEFGDLSPDDWQAWRDEKYPATG